MSSAVVLGASAPRELLAAAGCTTLAPVGAEALSSPGDRLAALRVHLSSAEVDGALAAWAVGTDLWSQGPLLVHGFGTRVAGLGIDRLAAHLADGGTLTPAQLATAEALDARDPVLAASLVLEKRELASGGCGGDGGAAFVDDQIAALGEPDYATRWSQLLGVQDAVPERLRASVPVVGPYVDQVIAVRSRGRAVISASRRASGQGPLLDPVTGDPLAWDDDLCAFVPAPTHTARIAPVSVPCER